MMTNEEKAAADAAYAALPGTPPDFREFCEIGLSQSARDLAIEIAQRLEKAGATSFRWTIHEGCLWVEGWYKQPHKEAPFVPTRTATP